jgi:hypothetical protein
MSRALRDERKAACMTLDSALSSLNSKHLAGVMVGIADF